MKDKSNYVAFLGETKPIGQANQRAEGIMWILEPVINQITHKLSTFQIAPERKCGENKMVVSHRPIP